jgi:hypothetical protein
MERKLMTQVVYESNADELQLNSMVTLAEKIGLPLKPGIEPKLQEPLAALDLFLNRRG